MLADIGGIEKGRAYVLFSPFGLRNHEATEKTAMKMMLTRIDQLKTR